MQLQNLRRHNRKLYTLDIIDDLRAGAKLDWIEHFHGPGLQVASELLRPAFIAPPTSRLLWIDFASIEARTIAWLANDEDTLDVFRRWDRGDGEEPYVRAAREIYGSAFVAGDAAAERRIGIAHRLAGLIADPRNPLLVTHSVVDILRARMLAIACGYEDADDLDHLRTDPGFKLACGRLPDTGDDLCSQPTMSRWENAPSLREVVRMTYAMIDAYCASYPRPPVAVTLDIDDTVDVVHGHQQLSLFNAHYDERCFLPIHVYETATSRPVAVLLRPGKTPSGDEVRRHLRRLVRRIRSHWPTTRLTIRGDGHYSRPEVMAWCEANDVDYVFGLPGNGVLSRLVEIAADDVRVRRSPGGMVPRCSGP